MRPTLHTRDVITRLALLDWDVALGTLCRVLLYERKTCFLLFLENGALGGDTGACTAVEEVAVPGLVA